MCDEQGLTILQYNTRKSREVVMIPLFEDLENILKVDIIALQEPWRNQRDLTAYHPLKQNFELIYLPSIETRVCFYVRKGIALSSWTYTHHSADYTTLHLFTTNHRKIHVHNIYNQMKGGNAPFSTLRKLEEVLSEYAGNKDEHLVLGDFNLHHPAWGGEDSTTIDPEAEDLISLTLFNNLSQMIPEGTITYEEGNKKSTIDLIFASPLLAEGVQMCDTQTTFDHDSDHLLILSQWTLNVVEAIPEARRRFTKTNTSKFLETLQAGLDPVTAYLDLKSERSIDQAVSRLVNQINEAINASTPLARTCTVKLPRGFDSECKEAQMRCRQLKKRSKSL